MLDTGGTVSRGPLVVLYARSRVQFNEDNRAIRICRSSTTAEILRDTWILPTEDTGGFRCYYTIQLHATRKPTHGERLCTQSPYRESIDTLSVSSRAQLELDPLDGSPFRESIGDFDLSNRTRSVDVGATAGTHVEVADLDDPQLPDVIGQ